MKRRRRVLLILLALGVVVGAVVWPRNKEPSYQGRGLSYWLLIYSTIRPPDAANHEAEIAVREIGPKAVPCLVEWISYEPGPTAEQLGLLLDRVRGSLLGRPILSPVIESRAQLRASSACCGFEILGPSAGSAAPELLKHLSRARDQGTRLRLLSALRCLGRDGIVAFCQVLTNYSVPTARTARTGVPSLRHDAALFLGGSGKNGVLAVPALIKCLADADTEIAADAASDLGVLGRGQPGVLGALTNALLDRRVVVRAAAADALSRFGAEDEMAVPALVRALADGDMRVRKEATNSLRKIAPEVFGTGGER